jgi:phosphoribosyl 1,2-cyclic phosphate phosphodiesterase
MLGVTGSELFFLGTGTSVGVPVAGCDCRTCRSSDPHDTRFNASALFIRDGFHLLVDCGPDFRHSAIKFHVPRIDAVWVTHAHYDHFGGLDYLRIYNQRQKAALPLYLASDVYTYFKEKTLNYIFQDKAPEGGGVAQFIPMPLGAPSELAIGPFQVTPVVVMHGSMPVWNLRIDKVAYLTDCNAISADAEAKLQGLDTLVLSALRYKAHPTHFTIDEALAALRRLRPKQAYLMHFTHDVHHQSLLCELKQKAPDLNVRPAYDGLRLMF